MKREADVVVCESKLNKDKVIFIKIDSESGQIQSE